MKNSFFPFGIPLWRPTKADLCAVVRSLPKRDSCLKIFTPNSQILWQAHQDPQDADLLRQADLLLPDGFGVFLASRLCGAPLPCRTNGIDFAEQLLQYGNAHRMRVYFLGGKSGVAERAAARMNQKFPNLCVAGTHHGYFPKIGTDAERVLRQIQAARPELLLVALGFPEQEAWIAEHADSVQGLKAAIGVGGSFDVWSGRILRAPKAVQALGLEWLWRSLREPKRIRNWSCFPKFLYAARQSTRPEKRQRQS